MQITVLINLIYCFNASNTDQPESMPSTPHISQPLALSPTSLPSRTKLVSDGSWQASLLSLGCHADRLACQPAGMVYVDSDGLSPEPTDHTQQKKRFYTTVNNIL